MHVHGPSGAYYFSLGETKKWTVRITRDNPLLLKESVAAFEKTKA